MKLQAILFAVLQTSAVVLADAADGSSIETNCETPCRTTNLRMTMEKMKDCLQLHCGAQYNASPSEDNAEDTSVDDVDIDLSSLRAGPYRSCISQCKRNRLTHRGIVECKDDCKDQYRNNGRDRDYPNNSDGGRYGTSNSGRYNDGGRTNGFPGRSDDFPGNDTACVARCKRLRFSPHKQDECITDCADQGDSTSDKRSDFDASDTGDADENVFPGNDTACVARCKRLRFGPHKQVECITDCAQEEEGDATPKKSDFGTKNEEEGSNSADDAPDFSGNSCKARCMRLRFGPHKQKDCLSRCPTDDFYARAA